jgi:hypothetical protein
VSSAPFLLAAEVAAEAGIRDPLRWRSLTCLHFRHSVAAYVRTSIEEFGGGAWAFPHVCLIPARLTHLQALAIPAKEASWDLL